MGDESRIAALEAEVASLRRQLRAAADLEIWSDRKERQILEHATALLADLRIRWRGRRHVMLDELRPLTAILDQYPPKLPSPDVTEAP
jgi:uncharacterized protein involved in exopolysaccharide biosynthesis